ncbi:MAG: LPS export ABC transporter ATP-binding protein [Opitutales bacterium]
MTETAATTPASPAAGTTPPHRIQTRGLVKTYSRRRVVDGVDIHVDAGEVVGLLGPNGAGKTTTFYMVVGLVPATEGAVYLDDAPITRLPLFQRARLGIGYLPQEASAFRKLTVRANLKAVAEALPISRAEQAERIDGLIRELGLVRVAGQKAFTLSGGERRRLEIARALVTRPRFLLLDEPFSGVDPISVADVQDIVLRLKARGIGVLITDHNVRETLSITDRAYLLFEGRVLAEGDRDFLISDPESRKLYLGERFKM